MGRGKRTINRKEQMTYEEDDKERDEQATEEEDDEEDDDDAEASDEDSGDDDSGGDDDDDDAPKKKKPAKKKAKPTKVATAKPKRPRGGKVVRMRAVWGVFNNSNTMVAKFDFPQREEAEAHAAKLRTDKGGTYFVIQVKEEIK